MLQVISNQNDFKTHVIKKSVILYAVFRFNPLENLAPNLVPIYCSARVHPMPPPLPLLFIHRSAPALTFTISTRLLLLLFLLILLLLRLLFLLILLFLFKLFQFYILISNGCCSKVLLKCHEVQSHGSYQQSALCPINSQSNFYLPSNKPFRGRW